MTRWTEADLERYQARTVNAATGTVSTCAVPVHVPVSQRKYGNRPTVVYGIRFDSLAEAKRYGELKLLELAGQIRELEVHPEFPLSVANVRLGKYVADFRYLDAASPDLPLVVEDVKGREGTKTPLYRWKKRHMEAEWGIQIREIS